VTGQTDDRVVQTTTSAITWANRWDHFLARWAIHRGGHRVAPGLNALGHPTADEPVFVTANYTLSFDALRAALVGMDGYILVLDTKGINVWCAAGKGTFGTDELVQRIEVTGLKNVVRHRTLILPQLGAPGIAAHQIKKQTGFKVEYGPVRAADLPAYLKTHQATPEMRRVHFSLRDRLVLIPVELVAALLPMLLAAVALYLVGGSVTSSAVIAAVLAGTVLFPILLPWLPTHEFSTRGLILGGIVALFFALMTFLSNPNAALWLRVVGALTFLISLPPITAFLALNFTGATTFTSRTGVRREIFAYIPVMAWMFGAGIALTIARAAIKILGGA
jgi:hypothetical protein